MVFVVGVPPQLLSVIVVVACAYPAVHWHCCVPPGSTAAFPPKTSLALCIQIPLPRPNAQPTPVVGIIVVEFGPAPRSTTLFCWSWIEVTYHVPEGMFTTL